MTCHRYMYKLCWKNRLVLPVCLLLGLAFLLIPSLYSADIEYLPDGRVRIKYGHRHALIPRTHEIPGRDSKKKLLMSLTATNSSATQSRQTHGHRHRVYVGEDMDEEVLVVRNNGEIQVELDDGQHKSAKPSQKNIAQNLLHGHGDDTAAVVHWDIGKDVGRQDGGRAQGELKLEPLGGPGPQAAKPGNRSVSARNARKQARARFKRLFKPGWKPGLYYDSRYPPEEFQRWHASVDVQCEEKFHAYANQFIHLRNLVIDLGYCTSSRKGGEKINHVLNQAEEVEYFKYDMGCFQMACNDRPSAYFYGTNHLNDWLFNMKTRNVVLDRLTSVQHDFTIAIVRYEYANVYHTMTDWYNAFLVMQFFNKTQAETNILLVDTHPSGQLDPVWPILFNSTHRMSFFRKRTLFTDIVWGIQGYSSPMLEHTQPHIPLTEEFRTFFLSSFNVPDNHVLSCDTLTVLFIWRRDYVAHPRNPTGSISRKIYNERGLIEAVQKQYPNFLVKGAQIDLFDMRKQLDLVVNADIMIGMHGAGLTHALFLPKHAALIELVPSYWSAANEHFSAIATWRSLIYEQWVNEEPDNEVEDNYTYIPPAEVLNLMKKVLHAMCHVSIGATDSSTQN